MAAPAKAAEAPAASNGSGGEAASGLHAEWAARWAAASAAHPPAGAAKPRATKGHPHKK